MAADLTSGIVIRVIDGDTSVLDTGEKIRLAGINSRKLVRENRPAEPLANETKSALEGLLVDGRAQVEVSQEAKDRYGRILAYLFTPDGQSVQRWLLLDGLASVVVILPNDRYLREYTAAEDKARNLRRGIWSLSFYPPRSSVVESIAGGYAFVHGVIENVELGDTRFMSKLETGFLGWGSKGRLADELRLLTLGNSSTWKWWFDGGHLDGEQAAEW